MAEVKIYTRAWCGYCTAALSLLRRKGVKFEEIDVAGQPEMRRWLAKMSGQTTVPQIFINRKSVGGYTDLRALDERGVLDDLLEIDGHGSSVSG